MRANAASKVMTIWYFHCAVNQAMYTEPIVGIIDQSLQLYRANCEWEL